MSLKCVLNEPTERRMQQIAVSKVFANAVLENEAQMKSILKGKEIYMSKFYKEIRLVVYYAGTI